MDAVEIIKPQVGIWTFTAYEGDVEKDETGRVLNPIVKQWWQKNLIVTNGKNLLLARLFNVSTVISAATPVSGIAVGTSATAAAVGDTAITGAVYQAFDAAPTATSLNMVATTTYATGTANINIQEVGLLTASGGILFNRLAPVLSFTKTSAVSLAISVTITQS